ncbi:hypothetical protein [Roseateles toxinivorans]|uniref:Uncharacterized protein n=1 Tax=Roseateles toxinivorans TaxID=270368 RepID=A0A4R6QQF6_9BURK|nr:hypothetical protein [Roseateles toxinivorans]TDP72953.1 hypothetical protein DES47_102699 [Roseateles toxinivorans]
MAPLFFIFLGFSALALPVVALSRLNRLMTGVPDSNDDFVLD